MSYTNRIFYSPAITATGTVTNLYGSIDVSELDKFYITYSNDSSASVDVVHLQVETSTEPNTAVTSGSTSKWVSVTGIIAVPSALSANAITASTPIDNVYKYLRINVRTSTTMAANDLKIAVAGFKRIR